MAEAETATPHNHVAVQQITPFLWFGDEADDAAKSNRVMKAMAQMKKLDIARLQAACDGK